MAHNDETCGAETLRWVLTTNEDGWHCDACGERAGGEPPGYRPDLDQSQTEEKVRCVLDTLHGSDLVYISNSDQGEHVISHVVRACQTRKRFDQYTIIGLIVEQLDSHSDYWAKIAQGVLTGTDTRDRCHCGALSTSATLADGKWTYRCSAHSQSVTMSDLLHKKGERS